MRKSLSVVLAVVMLAALITVFPASAAIGLPQLVITEICVDTTGWSASGSDTSDAYEFIEIANTGSTPVNLYEYAIVYANITAGADPAGTKIGKVNPIQSPADSPNAAGTIGTSANASNDPSKYVTNPATAVLNPGQVAVIWMYTFDAYNSAKYAKEAPLTFEEFKSYWRMDKYSDEALADIVIVAVDANNQAEDKTGTVYLPDGTSLGAKNYYGSSSAATDLTRFNGRFNGANSGSRAYGIIKTDDIDVNESSAPTTTIGECLNYVKVNYDASNADTNLMYKDTAAAGQARAGSLADITYNFVYTNNANTPIGKAANNLKFGDWDRMSFGTPGLLLPSQMDNMDANEAEMSENVAYIQNRVVTDETSIRYIVYQENFFGMADTAEEDRVIYDPSNVDTIDQYKTDTQTFFDKYKLGWEMTSFLSNGGTVRYYIENEKLICDNLDVDLTGDGKIVKADGDIDSTDALVIAYPSLKMEKIARSNYTIEYEVTYLDANENNRYCGVIYNFNEKTSYDIFILRVNGSGNNQRRIGGSTYCTYDYNGSTYYAPNGDTVPGQTSIIYKITGGEFTRAPSTGVDMWTYNDEQKAVNAPMLGRVLNVRMEINQVTGPAYYINDILVTKAATVLADPGDKDSAVAAYPYWGAQTNYGEFAIGFFVSQRVKLAIDNIKITGWVNEYTEADMLRAYANTENKEPATGDATIYVTIAMAVSFVSLAALVVAKRRSSVK